MVLVSRVGEVVFLFVILLVAALIITVCGYLVVAVVNIASIYTGRFGVEVGIGALILSPPRSITPPLADLD